jgi:hypothetical protein
MRMHIKALCLVIKFYINTPITWAVEGPGEGLHIYIYILNNYC